jgi:hypothetical protein
VTEFDRQLRFYCRNPRCRMRLKAPVENPKEAFCAKGCHGSFYRRRCLICEGEMERKTERQLVCGKRRCRNALPRADSLNLGRYAVSPIDPLEKSIKSGIKSGDAGDRAWRIVAGADLSPSALHCATVPDGGEHERLEARNMDLLADAWTKSRRNHCAKRVEHVRQDAAPSDWQPGLAADWRTLPDLPIPNFLRRIPKPADIFSKLIPQQSENTETPDFFGTINIPKHTTNMSSVAFST